MTNNTKYYEQLQELKKHLENIQKGAKLISNCSDDWWEEADVIRKDVAKAQGIVEALVAPAVHAVVYAGPAQNSFKGGVHV